MRLFSKAARAACFVLFPIPLVACVVETRDRHDDGRRWSDTPPPANTAGTSTQPLRVIVDTDQVMEASPGQGVGVFVEYARGGTWHVWWTCDTTITHRACNFDVRLSSPDALNVVEATASVSQPTPSSVDVSTSTTDGVDQIKLTTAPGGVLTLEAYVDGVRDPAYIFFVQNGQVNGDYNGSLTNPLELQGNLP